MHEGQEDHLTIEIFNRDPENYNILLYLFQILEEQNIQINAVYSEEYLPWSLFSELLNAIRVQFGLSRGKF
jgi:hypothetical protein